MRPPPRRGARRLMLTRILLAVRSSGAHGRIARSMGVVGVFLLITRFAGAFKEIVTAGRFGVSEVVDAYVLAFALVMLLPSVWAGVMSMVYVPISKQLDDEERQRFTAELTGLSLIAGLVLWLAIRLVMPPLVPLIWDDFTPAGQAQLTRFFVWLAPMVVLAVLVGQCGAQLIAMERHVNSLTEGVPSLVIALFVLLHHSADPTDPFIAGSLVGVLLQLAILVVALRSLGRSGRIAFRFRERGWTLFRNALGIMIASTLIMSLTRTADLLFASQIGPGSVATFGYGQRVLLLGMSLGATAVGRAMLPVLSARGERGEDARRIAGQWAGLMLVVGIVAIPPGWFAMPTLVRVLFERGAFTPEDTVAVTEVIRFGLVQVPFYLSGVVVAQYVASQRRFGILLGSSVVALTVKLSLGWVLSRELGVPGIMLSAGGMYFCTFLYLWLWMRRDGRALDDPRRR